MAAMAGNFAISIVTAASLNYLWSMLNGLQLQTHLELFNLKFPANASFLQNFLITIATFDITPIEAIWFFFDLPELGSYSPSFGDSGYDYIFLVENMGTCFFMVQIYILFCLVTLGLGILIKYCSIPKAQPRHKKMKDTLFWGTAIRFVFESYLELVICVTIGMVNISWSQDNLSIPYCSVFTVVFMLAVFIMPLFTSVFYYWKIDKVEEEQFTSDYGTLYDGLELDAAKHKRKSALIYPFLFIFRRLAFSLSVFAYADFAWAQIAIQFASCLTMLMYLGFIFPFESDFVNRIEIFNELAGLLLCYFMFCFSDWIPEATMRYLVGWAFILMVCGHLSTHLVIVARSTFQELKETFKAKYAKAKEIKQKLSGKEIL